MACRTDICLKAVHCLIPDHLIKSCGKQVERGEDAPIGAQAILLHDILVIYLEHKQHFVMGAQEQLAGTPVNSYSYKQHFEACQAW